MDGSHLRPNQIGAISAVQAHFSLHTEPALLAMPTGSGKTAVLMALAFVLRAGPVLVVTPSVIVREQIAEGFRSLDILKRTGVLPLDCPPPRVHEVTGWLATEEAWRELEGFDVVIASPPSISPRPGQVAPPPEKLFDLVLVDEAHHEQAPTWKALLDSFGETRRVLCSATPFRNDRQRLGARIVYHYPLKRAQEDGIFGRINFVPINPGAGEDADVLIALKAAELLAEDRDQGLDHRLMVRTSVKSRASALAKIYADHTSLKLQEIHSGLQPSTIRRRIEALKKGELDGVICVDMMGEGFDFPNLKIAAIHAPHKSLPITLQFIGRFARTGHSGQPLGDARFIAEENRIRHDEFQLYSSDPEEPDWREIIANLNDRRVAHEVENQALFDSFRPTRRPSDRTRAARELSLGALEPFHHAKVYQLPDGAGFDLEAMPKGMDVLYSEVSDDRQAAVIVWDEVETPRWLTVPVLDNVRHHLLVVYFVQEQRLLFVCSTQKEEDTYEAIVEAFAPDGAYELPAPQLRRVLTGWTDPEIYNIGMRNRQAAIGQESYRILTGSAAQHAISERDGQRFTRGHAFGASVEPDSKKTLGISSNYAKIWSLRYAGLNSFLKWCRALASKLSDPAADSLPTPLDALDGGTVVTSFPDPQERMLLMADWPAELYHLSRAERRLHLTAPGVVGGLTLHPTELEVRVRQDESTVGALRFDLAYREHILQCRLELTPRPQHVVLPGQAVELRVAQRLGEEKGISPFLDSHAPQFWYDDLSSVTRNVHYRALDFEPQVPGEIFKMVDWAAAAVDITAEITCEKAGYVSIHDHLRRELDGKHQVVFFDHDTGEAADFITLDLIEDDRLPVRVNFYHCKGSKEDKAGSRVGDMYEVLGQAVKCLRYRDRNLLRRHLAEREKKYGAGAPGKSRFVTGDLTTVGSILSTPGPLLLPITVWVVQPGLDRAKAEHESDPKMGRLIDNVLYFTQDHGSSLRIMCS
ncbi:DEAD/DEAH box helicase [Deinococcus radiopugnans]|uniref:DEAD/DEAH box helicase n=1 Tax=Deinococcus radiopugnans ATCC 19172 TaxID=585398 RepID=A0A5C4Y8Z5_9DEIO|nr:DEAD/DEAH box helicase family protein [Deinococcus radiopugnans]MBB6017437.1 superfamily II DNA or RNA helicase [Deinococcus radiopugnans ATCC 19172]TNM71968.1 DEAD/DEAH box helicase [Deinococcus radiopugnans ATCC 19172]